MALAAARAGCLWLGLWAAASLCACDDRPGRSAPGRSPELPSAGATSAPPAGPRKGVRVPLPPGWAARPGPGGDLFIGPSGTSVLRVSARPGEGDALPSPEALKALLPEPARAQVKVAQPGADALVVSFSSVQDGGSVGFVGARRVGQELFLCAGTPALRSEWLEAAAEACAGISLGGGG